MTHEETIDELVEVLRLAIEMRTWQALYFKGRKTDALIASKSAEKAFDLAAGRALSRHAPRHVQREQ